jgi:hypothetical protein
MFATRPGLEEVTLDAAAVSPTSSGSCVPPAGRGIDPPLAAIEDRSPCQDEPAQDGDARQDCGNRMAEQR